MSRKNNRFIKKNVRKANNLADSEKKPGHLSLPILISIFSLIVAISGIGINFWFSNKNYKKQYDEDLRITITRRFENYNTEIKEGIGKKYILVHFNCLIVNNSEKSVVIESFESTSYDGLRKGYGLYYGSDSTTLVKLPIKIESRENKRFIIQEYMPMDTVAFSLLKSSLPMLSNLPMNSVEHILAKNGRDAFGCKASMEVNNGQEIISYGDPGDLYERESFTADFETTNGAFKAKYSYYFDPNEKW